MSEPRRERITSPLTSARTHVPRTVRQEIHESTGVGEVYVRSLVRSQLRAAVTVVASVALTIGLLPVVFVVFGDLSGVTVGGIGLPWIVLGIAVYPAVFVLGWLYVRFAERAEVDFAALVAASATEEES